MRIGELAHQVGTNTKTIRFYEAQGLLPEPARTPSGYRDYGDEFVERLEFIRRGQAAGLSLREIAQIVAISDRGEAPCAHVRQLLADRREQVREGIAELEQLDEHLSALLEQKYRKSTEHDRAAVCWILEATQPGAPGLADTRRAIEASPNRAPRSRRDNRR
jgi:DNA-binding transcriptional MerR regulator